MRKILTALAALPSLALASGYSLPNTNPRDLALSASAVAAQNNAAAAFALPASLSRLEGPSASISAGGVTVFHEWTDPTGAEPSTKIDEGITPIGNLYVGYGGKSAALGGRGWGVGFGLQPFGGAVITWPDDWAGRYRIVEVDRRVYSGVLTGGVEVLPRVRLGGGLVYYYTRQELTQKAFMGVFSPTPTDPSTWPGDATATLDVNGGALSFDVSAEWQPLANLPLTVAVDYKHKATQELDGDVTWANLAPGALLARGAGVPGTEILFDQGAKQTLTIPNVLNIGVAYRVTKPLLVTATWTLDRWKVYDRDLFVGDNGASINVQRDYSNGWTARAGVEYDVMPALTVRVGAQRDESGLKEEHYSPTLPDASSWAGSLGATWRFGGGLALDAAVFYAIMDEVEVPASAAGLEPPATLPSPLPTGTFRGSYDTSALIYALSLGWTPGAK